MRLKYEVLGAALRGEKAGPRRALAEALSAEPGTRFGFHGSAVPDKCTPRIWPGFFGCAPSTVPRAEEWQLRFVASYPNSHWGAEHRSRPAGSAPLHRA